MDENKPSLLSRIAHEVWARVVVSNKSTIVGWLLAAAVIACNEVLLWATDWQSPYAKYVAVAVGLIGSALKKKQAAAALLVLFLALPAFAQEAPEPRFGGCLEGHPGVCFAPTVSFNLMAMSLSTGDITTTFDVGPGYGVTFWSDKWHRLGISASASFPLYEGKRRIEPALVFSFAEFARIGLSCPTYVAGGFEGNARLLLSLGVNLWSW